MNPGDIRKLLGGYAADTLTAEERQSLFEAALTDQDLFDELAHEQALKELLEEPAARRQLLAALDEKPLLLDRFRAWLGRPVAWVAVGSLAVAALLVVVVVRRTEAPSTIKPVLTAKLETPSLPEPSRSVPRDVAPAAAKPKERVEPPAQAVATDEKDIRAEASTKALTAENAPIAPPAEKEQAVAALSVAAPAPPPPPVKDVPQAAVLRQPAAVAARSDFRQVAGGALDRASLVAASPFRYRIQRAGADGSFVDAAPLSVFGRDDRVRVVLTSSEQGHLRLTGAVAGRSRTLLDADIAKGATVNLDVPADVRDLQGIFAWAGIQPQRAGAKGGASPLPVEEIIAIPIPREPAP
jgi:cytoskeletal protein RodZ